MTMRQSSSSWLPVIAGATMVLFTAGIVWLFQLRFSIGDIYAPYSSLRADQFGTAALHDALALQPGLNVRRLYGPMLKLPEGPGCTLFILGSDPDGLYADSTDLSDFDRFLRAGGRAVISCRVPLKEPRKRSVHPADESRPEPGDRKEAGEKKEPQKDKAPETVASLDPEMKELGKFYGFRFVRQPVTSDIAEIIGDEAVADLPDELVWHGAASLECKKPADWRSLYAASHQPVIAERQIGNGTLVLLADTWHLSNEAMADDRQIELLNWLIGARTRTVLFEESHLGTEHRDGVMSLVRRYRLLGVLLSFAAVALLYVWRQAAGGMRTSEEAEEILAVPAGQETATGLLHLLKRNIPSGTLLRTCIEQWAADQGRQAQPETAAAIARLPAGKSRDANLAGLYRTICETLKPKRR